MNGTHGGHGGKPGGPGGFGQSGRDRGRPGGDRRGPGGREGPATGKAGVESFVLGALKEGERALTGGDFDAQKALFTRLLERIKPLRLKSMDDLEFDCRTRLFTALLRAGRQTPSQEPEKEAKRKEVLGLAGELWQALGDEHRAALLFASAGRTEPALRMLSAAGEWQEAAALYRKEGKLAEAARLYEQHQDWAGALSCFKEAGEIRGWLRAALTAKDLGEAREAARKLPSRAVRDVLLKQGHGDLLLDILAERGEWIEIAHLYERAEQWADAAQAWERGARTIKAAEAWRKAGDEAAAVRNIEREVGLRLGKNDAHSAGDLLRRFGLVDRAAEVVAPSNPELAHRWLLEGGQDAKALEFAREHAEKARSSGQPAQAARWLERAGEPAQAAQLLAEAGLHLEALRLFEQLGDWERAGEEAAKAGQRDRALEYLRRAGVADPESRLPSAGGAQTPV